MVAFPKRGPVPSTDDGVKSSEHSVDSLHLGITNSLANWHCTFLMAKSDKIDLFPMRCSYPPTCSPSFSLLTLDRSLDLQLVT